METEHKPPRHRVLAGKLAYAAHAILDASTYQLSKAADTLQAVLRDYDDEIIDEMERWCLWSLWDEDHNAWKPGCDADPFQPEDGTPKENGLRHCHGCGERILVDA